MAYKDSSEIATNSNYTLGDYSFRIDRTSVPGSTNDKIEAICTDKDGKNARKSIQVPSSTQLNGWYVEANETEASVYVVLKDSGSIRYTTFVADGEEIDRRHGRYVYRCSGAPKLVLSVQGGTIDVTKYGNSYYAANFTGTVGNTNESSGPSDGGVYWNVSIGNAFEQQGLNVYGALDGVPVPESTIDPTGKPAGDYGKDGPVLVARFAIDLEDAGGVGPGSDWIDPGDYDPDWEPEDPTHTLYVTVTGALSGRHNDPIEDPSYSYIPADKDTVKDYGCGGDGGHGGGGGAGASTVVIHKFATNQANSKEVTAIARRHGYGSGGGKGGKGGDGCILVYY